jgi:glycosyltransferase involved in cell wall biosynthesis
MKILMVAHSFPPEAFAGVEIHVYNLARILGERYDLHVFHRVEDREAPEFSLSDGEYEGVRTLRMVNNFTRMDPHGLEVYPGARAAFGEVLDRLRPDVVHIHHLICLSADLVDEAAARGIPVVASLHDYWYLCARVQLYVPGKGRCPGPSIFRCADCFEMADELIHSMSRFSFLGDKFARAWMKLWTHVEWPSIYALYERRFKRMRETLSRFDLILANSHHLMNRYIRFGAPASRMRVLHPGMDSAPFKACRHATSAKVRFGYMGSIIEHKGIHLLIDAFRQVPEASLRIWGDGEINSVVREYRASLGPSENVRFMGAYSHDEIHGVLSGIDVLVVPPIWEEAFGLTVDEARQAGIPVIASRIGGIPEHLRHGKEGYLFTPGSVEELVQLIRKLTGRPDRVEKLRPLGDDVSSLFDNADDVEGAYRQVILRKKS